MGGGRDQDGELPEEPTLILQIKSWSSPDTFPRLCLRERKEKVKYEFWEHC